MLYIFYGFAEHRVKVDAVVPVKWDRYISYIYINIIYRLALYMIRLYPFTILPPLLFFQALRLRYI